MENETGGEGEKETNAVMQMPEPSVVYTASYGAAALNVQHCTR